jgi:nitroimidazol reductase NimA-like FMN-containing flavoprotein (pyridoxamine 5'-phosphate oxidase superfamily)
VTQSDRAAAGPSPTFHELGRDEIERIIARNHVGRIAFSLHDRVDIEPISYVFDNGWIYGRTSHGTKLLTIAHHRWVAFEVDEVEGMFDWRSVVVKGAFYLIDPDTSVQQDPAFTRGVELLRSLMPETLTADDPVPFRNSVFRIHLDEVRGRAASS